MPIAIKNILLAYDGFDRREGLAAQAIALAEEHGAQLHVLHVGLPAPTRAWQLQRISAEVLYQSLLNERRARLEHLATQARKWGIDTRAKIRRGTPHIEIISEAIEVQADLVIVSDHSRSDGRRGFGTLTASLLRACPCPVLASSDLGQRSQHRILAAIELSPSDPAQDQINQRVIDSAVALAKSAGSKLFVFHTWSLWGECILRSNPAITQVDIQGLLAAERQYRLQQLSLLIASCDLEGLNAELELQKGRTGELLPRFVARNDIDLVVLGTPAPVGVEGVRIGNTAEMLIHELSCSLLIVKF